MGFDTTYRPRTFEEVAGQKNTIQVLEALLSSGGVFERSYVFAGPSGTGKTTMARILARAMLCEQLGKGSAPCDTCSSCKAMLSEADVPSFREMDAANHSGADNVRQLVAALGYHVFGAGDRIVYLIDEAHRLSAQAMDALLKPMEDTIPGTRDKRLVGLFCTTEPHKLRDTIKGRSMVFSVLSPTRDEAVTRLAHICTQEGLDFDPEALGTIFEFGRGHMRDMVTALERVSYAGAVTSATVRDQLGLGMLDHHCAVLESLSQDATAINTAVEAALATSSAASVHAGVLDVGMAAYRLANGITTGLGVMDRRSLKRVSQTYEGETLLHLARHLLKNPVTDDTSLMCELLYLRQALLIGTLGQTGGQMVVIQAAAAEVPASQRKSPSPSSKGSAQHAEVDNRKWAGQVMKHGAKASRGLPVKDAHEDQVQKRFDMPRTRVATSKGIQRSLSVLLDEET